MDGELEQVEYRLLCGAIQDACRELRQGRAHSGRRHLLDGLERAAEYANAGLSWGDALADEYRRALREFDELCDPYLQRLRDFRSTGGDPRG